MIELDEQQILVDIVQEFFPNATVAASWLPDHVLQLEVELGFWGAMGPWGPRIDGARVAVALHVAEWNKHREPGWRELDAVVALRFSAPATMALATAHGVIGVAERFLS